MSIINFPSAEVRSYRVRPAVTTADNRWTALQSAGFIMAASAGLWGMIAMAWMALR